MKVTQLRASGSWHYAPAHSADGRRLADGAGGRNTLLWDLRPHLRMVQRIQRPVRTRGLRGTGRSLSRQADDQRRPDRRHPSHEPGGSGIGGDADRRVRPRTARLKNPAQLADLDFARFPLREGLRHLCGTCILPALTGPRSRNRFEAKRKEVPMPKAPERAVLAMVYSLTSIDA